MTVPHFTDYAANQRTFLAWVRTAIAVMAFGFVVERFDIFLEVAGQSLGARTLSKNDQIAGSIVGLALIFAGAGMVLVAIRRFLYNRGAIASETVQGPADARPELVLASLIVVLGLALGGYLARALIGGHE